MERFLRFHRCGLLRLWTKDEMIRILASSYKQEFSETIAGRAHPQVGGRAYEVERELEQ